MASYSEMVEIERTVDANSKEVSTKEKRVTREVKRLDEPDYIKLYTNMWCEFNGIPAAYRNLFLELAVRMSYTDASNLSMSQIVYTGKPISDDICKCLGWQNRMYQKGLKVLCDCGAIRKVNRGVYQISPKYVGRGKWKYDPRLKQGGVSELVASFDFVNQRVNTHIAFDSDVHATSEDREFFSFEDRDSVTHIMSSTEETESGEETEEF